MLIGNIGLQIGADGSGGGGGGGDTDKVQTFTATADQTVFTITDFTASNYTIVFSGSTFVSNDQYNRIGNVFTFLVGVFEGTIVTFKN